MESYAQNPRKKKKKIKKAKKKKVTRKRNVSMMVLNPSSKIFRQIKGFAKKARQDGDSWKQIVKDIKKYYKVKIDPSYLAAVMRGKYPSKQHERSYAKKSEKGGAKVAKKRKTTKKKAKKKVAKKAKKKKVIRKKTTAKKKRDYAKKPKSKGSATAVVRTKSATYTGTIKKKKKSKKRNPKYGFNLKALQKQVPDTLRQAGWAFLGFLGATFLTKQLKERVAIINKIPLIADAAPLLALALIPGIKFKRKNLVLIGTGIGLLSSAMREYGSKIPFIKELGLSGFGENDYSSIPSIDEYLPDESGSMNEYLPDESGSMADYLTVESGRDEFTDEDELDAYLDPDTDPLMARGEGIVGAPNFDIDYESIDRVPMVSTQDPNLPSPGQAVGYPPVQERYRVRDFGDMPDEVFEEDELDAYVDEVEGDFGEGDFDETV